MTSPLFGEPAQLSLLMLAHDRRSPNVPPPPAAGSLPAAAACNPVRLLMIVLGIAASTALAQPQQLDTLLRTLEGSMPAARVASGSIDPAAAAVATELIEWSIVGQVAYPYGSGGHLSVAAEASFDLDARERSDRRGQERALLQDLAALREAETRRRNQLELVSSYCRVVFLATVGRLFERHRDLASNEQDRAVWQAQRDLALQQRAVAGHDLVRLVPAAAIAPPPDLVTCSLASTFDFDRLLTREIEAGTHPELVESSLLLRQEQLFDDFTAATGGSLFLQASVEVGLEAPPEARYRIALGARLPLELPRPDLAADARVEVDLQGASLHIGLRSNRFDRAPDRPTRPVSPDEVIAQGLARLQNSIDTGLRALDLDLARERAAWLQLETFRSSPTADPCPESCRLALGAVTDPTVLDLLLDAVSASHRVQLTRLDLLDLLGRLPSSLLLSP